MLLYTKSTVFLFVTNELENKILNYTTFKITKCKTPTNNCKHRCLKLLNWKLQDSSEWTKAPWVRREVYHSNRLEGSTALRCPYPPNVL